MPAFGVARRELSFIAQHSLARQPQRQRRQRQQELPHRPPVIGDTDVLRHIADDPANRGVPLVSSQRAREHPKQRALANTIGTDKADMATVRHAKRHLGEQQLTARVRVSETRNGDMRHQSPTAPKSMVAMLIPGKRRVVVQDVSCEAPCHRERLRPNSPRPMEDSRMADSVYRVTEVIGVSSDSWEAAARSAVETAAKTVRDLRVAEVLRQDVTIQDGKLINYRVRLGISFKYDSDD
jgi:flavin-binding protein dodecin